MKATTTGALALTAGDLMIRSLVVVPQQMLAREATRLLYRAAANTAPVVDEHGHDWRKHVDVCTRHGTVPPPHGVAPPYMKAGDSGHQCLCLNWFGK